MDEQSPLLDNTYNYVNNGSGRTIYILDSGLDLSKSAVAAEFSGRASVLFDFNGGNGADCNGHGTMVATAAAGNSIGIAKGATVIVAKVTQGCTTGSLPNDHIAAFNWLAANAPAGTIVNWSHGYQNQNGSCNPIFDTLLENSMKAAHDNGIIIVVSAGNDGCNTANFSPTRIPEVFVVGATRQNLITQGKDAKAAFSRTGFNISTFAPGENLRLKNQNGSTVTDSGTSFSAPYISGVFAIACQAAGQFCITSSTAAPLHQALRNT